jgi:plasmid maintenance system killer protein
MKKYKKKNSAKLRMIGVDTHPGGTSLDINYMKTTSARNQVTKKNMECSQAVKSFKPLEFSCRDIQKLYETEEGSRKYSEAVVENFFEKMQILATVTNEQDLYNHKNLGFHKLKKGKLKGKYAVWLNGNWRLIVEIKQEQQSKYLLIKDIVDYH